jgi:AcrR family transcriptional regulator
MPRTRPEIDREAKMQEILEAAERRLLNGGYDALSMVGVARELGLAQAAIYWYFPSKDHLFVATLERLLKKIFQKKPNDGTTIERILWLTDQFRQIFDLRGALYEQARTSEVVSEFVTSLDDLVRHMLSMALRDHVSTDSLPLAVQTFRATIEGAFLQGLTKTARHDVITFAFQQLTEARSKDS